MTLADTRLRFRRTLDRVRTLFSGIGLGVMFSLQRNKQQQQ